MDHEYLHFSFSASRKVTRLAKKFSMAASKIYAILAEDYEAETTLPGWTLKSPGCISLNESGG